MTAVVVDDEARNIALFSYYLEKYCPNVQLEACFSKKAKAISYLRSKKPDILFLDIVLDNGSGFDVLDEVGFNDMQVVLCTAHDEFALRAIRYQVVDYLLKPLEIQELISTVNLIEKKLEVKNNKQIFNASLFSEFTKSRVSSQQRFPIQNKGAIEFVLIEDILSVESHKGTEKVEMTLRHHKKGEYTLVNKTLAQMEKKLSGSTFYRLSRACYINILAIETIHRNTQYMCTLLNGHRIIIPRNRYKSLLSVMEKVYETTI